MTKIKICGLSTPETLDAALDAGADYVGLVFFAPSPRNLALGAAAALAERARGRAKICALTVDADDAMLAGITRAVGPDILQLHGRETPDRVAAIRAAFGARVMKAIGVATHDDAVQGALYRDVADMILFDAKPPRDAILPGGNGRAFDWRLLSGANPGLPWMLSGGLDAGNAAEAIHVTGATAVDVSSGVESAPGIKDPAMIRSFIEAVRADMRIAAKA